MKIVLLIALIATACLARCPCQDTRKSDQNKTTLACMDNGGVPCECGCSEDNGIFIKV